MAEQFDLVIVNGNCVTSEREGPASIGIRDGRIAAVGDVSADDSAEVFDAKGLHVLPGVIDSQVHFREPGLEHKENLATGTAAAALGGVTAVFEMPNTKPATVTKEDFESKIGRLEGRVHCDVGFFIGASAENAEVLKELELLPGCVGVKVFMGSSTGSLLVADDENLTRVLASGRRRVAIHAEDEPRLIERRSIVEGGAPVHQHPVWRDEETALRATKRAIAVAEKTERPVHILHVTTGVEMDFLRNHKGVATVECTPQHLTLQAPDCYERLGTFAQMNPPIREGQVDRLWQAVADGTVDVIGSDHAPHTREEKAKDYPASPSGMPGVQTILPLMLNHMAEGRLSLSRLVELLCEKPAALYGATGRGSLDVGSVASFTVVDLGAEREITHEQMASRCGWTPFHGMKVKGWPLATIVRGSVVMRDGELLGDPVGRAVEFDA
jgi:dihydroorotase